MESAGVTQLFRALSPDNEPPANRYGDQNPKPGVPSSSAPEKRYHVDPKVNGGSAIIRRLFATAGHWACTGGAFRARGIYPHHVESRAGRSRPKRLRCAAPLASSCSRRTATAGPGASRTRDFPSFKLLRYHRLRQCRAQIHLQSKLQQMMPMLLVLNAFLLVVLIVLVVFLLKSR